tara:strand:- start:16138 stop:17310 length:1173 start_codon:yes stop_codon:yes gene_type:complete
MRLRVLFIGINRSYVNPTTDNILKAIGEFTDCYYYGPGYVSEQILEEGIEAFVQQKNNFDLLLTDSMIMEVEDFINNPYLFENETIYFEKRLYYKFAKGLKKFFVSANQRKIFIANWDYYIVSEKQVEYLINDPNLFVISNVDKNTSLSVEEVNRIGNKMIKNILNEYPNRNSIWHNFVTHYSHKIISVPNIVGRHNFIYTPISNRKYRYCVPGFPYAERICARKLYNISERIYHLRIEFLFLLEKISRKLYIPRPYNWGQKQIERLFYRVSNSRICFTSGAVTRTPIAKYFEIPAAGSVLVCQRFAGFENLGFKNGVNCFVAENIFDLESIIENYNEEKYQIIADAGRNLIWRFHSDVPRTAQLSECIERISMGKFKGSFWKDGEYILR